MKLLRTLPAVVLVALLSVHHAHASQPAAMRSSTQLIVVTTADWNAVHGTLQRYERTTPKKKWKAVGEPIAVVVGKNGFGWSESDFARRRANDPVKHEGDGRSPAGLFNLRTTFGYALQQPVGWRMPYIPLTPSVECVDDPRSKFYNRVVDRATVNVDWSSSEHMLYTNGQYRWGIVVDHNTAPVTPGAGSCIFLHIWLGTGEGTVGCTAMAQPNVETLLAWLDPQKKPLLLQLPRQQYKKLHRHWKLPKTQPPAARN